MMNIPLTIPLPLLETLLSQVANLVHQELALWINVSIPILKLGCFILVCLPVKSWKETRHLTPVENEEIFDHLFINKTSEPALPFEKPGRERPSIFKK